MSKQEIEDLVEGCRDLGWEVTTTSKGFYRILPSGGDPIIAPRNASGRSLGNFKAELRRAGYNPEAAAAAKAEKAAAAIKADRAHNEAALKRAAERAAERSQDVALAPLQAVPVVKAVAQVSSPLVNPFAPPETGAPAVQAPENMEFAALVGYRHYPVRVTQEQARKILAQTKENMESGRCRQRKLYRRHIAELQQGMEMGEWELNPVDSIVFCKEHGSAVNGRHRLTTLAESDPEFIDAFYPKDGVPFYVTYDFPCALSHIFDQGKRRNTTDALDFAGLEGWGQIPSAALKLVHQFDQSFEEGGEKNWTRWGRLLFTNTEKTIAASEDYSELLESAPLVSRAYRRSKVNRPAVMAAAFLLNRDNPEGWNPKNKRTTILFWKGVCGDDTMEVGDPRMALVRVAMRTGAKKRVDNGPTMLAHILKQYANYMIGDKRVDMSTVNTEQPMPPVWQPGMKWIRTDGIPILRHPMQ